MGGCLQKSTEVSALVATLMIPMLLFQFGDGLQITFAMLFASIRCVTDDVYCLYFLFYYIFASGYFFGFVLHWGSRGRVDGTSVRLNQCRRHVLVTI
jgi:MATE family multidrug resistance protein